MGPNLLDRLSFPILGGFCPPSGSHVRVGVGRTSPTRFRPEASRNGFLAEQFTLVLHQLATKKGALLNRASKGHSFSLYNQYEVQHLQVVISGTSHVFWPGCEIWLLFWDGSTPGLALPVLGN